MRKAFGETPEKTLLPVLAGILEKPETAREKAARALERIARNHDEGAYSEALMGLYSSASG